MLTRIEIIDTGTITIRGNIELSDLELEGLTITETKFSNNNTEYDKKIILGQEKVGK